MLTGGLVAAAVLVLAGVALWQARELRQLRQQQKNLQSQSQRYDADLAGLCSAAISVDKRLAESEALVLQLHDLFDQLQAPLLEKQPASATEPSTELEGYAKAIQMIVRGASVEELVKHCNMTRDEAMLLISVNRNKETATQSSR